MSYGRSHIYVLSQNSHELETNFLARETVASKDKITAI
jgi:hypothetical protein